MTGHRTVRIACVGLLLVAAALITGGTSALATGDVTITVNQVGSPIASAGTQGDFSLTVKATNNTNGPVNDTATLSLQLPAGVAPTSGCSGTSSPYSCDVPLVLADGDSDVMVGSIALHADPSSAGSYPSQAGSASTTGGLAIDPFAYDVNVAGHADLGVTLANSPSSGIVAGPGSFAASATVSNAGPSDSYAYTVTYSITGDTGMSFATSGQPAGCSPSGATLVCSTNPDLTPSGPGSSAVLPDVTVNAGADALGTYTVHAAVAPTTAGVTDSNSANDTATATAGVVGHAELGVTLANSPSSGIVAGPGSFAASATVSNAGPSDSHAYTVTYSITGGTGVSFAAGGQPAGCSPSGATLVCSTNPDLTPSGPGSSAVLPDVTVNAGADALGTYTVHAAVAPTTAAVTDSNSANDTATATAGVVSHADLSVTADGPGTAQIAGGPGFPYTLTVSNGGPSANHSDGAGNGYTVHLPLESGVHFSSGAGCGAVSGGVDCSGPGLAVNGSKTFTVNVTTDPDLVPLASQVSGTDLTDTATVTLATVTGASDPSSGNNTDDATVHIDARADLALGLTTTPATGVTPPYVAGDPTNGAFSYVYTVTNLNGPSTHKGDFTVTDKLPVGFVFQASSGCSAAGNPATTGQTVTCTDSGSLAPGAQKTFTVGVKVDHYVTDGSYSDVNPTVATGTTATPEPSGAGANNSPAAVSVTVKTIANLKVTAMTASAPGATLFANSASATVTLTLTYTNTGPSDTQGVTVSSPPPGASTLPAFVFAPTSTGLMAPGDSTTVTVSAKANPALGFAPPPSIVSGPFLVQDSLRVDPTLPTTDNDTNDNVKAGVLSPGITIDTVPSPVRNLSAAPGNTNVVVSWKAPEFNGGVSLDAANPYQIKVFNGATLVRTIAVPASAAQPCLGNTAGICFNVGIGTTITTPPNPPLTNGTLYTFTVEAKNAVGFSDDVPPPAQAKPSQNAQATIIPVSTARTLTTCTVATATQSPCVQYVIPSGAGGVAGVQGNVSPTATPQIAGWCVAVGGCAGNVALDLISAAYNVQDVNHPITEIVTWDFTQASGGLSSTIWYQSSSLNGGTPVRLPACSKGSVAKPDPCLKSLNVLGSKNNPDKNAQGDLQAQINLTSDVDGGTMKH